MRLVKDVFEGDAKQFSPFFSAKGNLKFELPGQCNTSKWVQIKHYGC